MRDWTSTMTAVAVGVIGGIIGLIVLAAVLSASGRSAGQWALTAALVLVCLGIAGLSNLRSKHRAQRVQRHPEQ